MPNARGEPRPIAEARHERTLSGVGSSARLGEGFGAVLYGKCAFSTSLGIAAKARFANEAHVSINKV